MWCWSSVESLQLILEVEKYLDGCLPKLQLDDDTKLTCKDSSSDDGAVLPNCSTPVRLYSKMRNDVKLHVWLDNINLRDDSSIYIWTRWCQLDERCLYMYELDNTKLMRIVHICIKSMMLAWYWAWYDNLSIYVWTRW